MTETQERTLRALRRGEALSVAEIAEYASITPAQARTAVKALVKDGAVKEAGVAPSGGRCYVVAQE